MKKATHTPKKYRSAGSNIFDLVVNAIIIIVGAAAAYPLIYVISASLSNPVEVNSGNLWLFPKGFQWDGYRAILKNHWIPIGYRNSILYTVLGTTINVVITVMASFSLSRKNLFGRKLLNWYIAIPMWFSGGLIPTYLVVNSLGMVNTPYILLIMGLVSSYNIIICRTFMSSLPYELQEAAKIDGANDFQILFRIVMPVSTPIIAVLCLYYAVSHWNNYFNAMIYVNNKNWQTLQVFLREILLLNQNINTDDIQDVEQLIEKTNLAQTMKYSLIVVSSIPLLIAYPMVQKYFVKGVMIGSVKG